jgi:hypothetical protein
MFKPVHGIRGYLAAALTSFATSMLLDDSSICLLQKALADGSYTYLIIQTAYNYEIVKAISFTGSSLNILRAQDGTTAQAFPSNSRVGFVLSQTAIEDIINQQMLGVVNITGKGIVTVTETGPNTFVISAPPIALTSESDKILVGGEFPNFVLSTPDIIDCCD